MTIYASDVITRATELTLDPITPALSASIDALVGFVNAALAEERAENEIFVISQTVSTWSTDEGWHANGFDSDGVGYRTLPVPREQLPAAVRTVARAILRLPVEPNAIPTLE